MASNLWAVLYFAICAIHSTKASTLGNHTDFCYRNDEGCGPNTSAWPPLCHNGSRQSPIDLPPIALIQGSLHLRLDFYKGSSFRMQNNGHSIIFDYVGGHGPNDPLQRFPFPDPLAVSKANKKVRIYKFASAHFHWGVNNLHGSEHCIGIRCSAMELHLVHYLANYSSPAEALASGDPNALAVIGVLINADKWNRLHQLSPLISHLSEVHQENPDEYVTVLEPLDLTGLVRMEPRPEVYSYKGSLTTPGCNQQVNWFVLRRPSLMASRDIQAIRTQLKDSQGEVLTENHRPIQARNGRTILLSRVSA